jgi:hypothetical protein
MGFHPSLCSSLIALCVEPGLANLDTKQTLASENHWKISRIADELANKSPSEDWAKPTETAAWHQRHATHHFMYRGSTPDGGFLHDPPPSAHSLPSVEMIWKVLWSRLE